MRLSSQLHPRVPSYTLILLLASSISYCAPPVGSHCNPSHLAGEDTAPSPMYPGYIFWPTPAEGKQSGRICVATFKTNHGSMSSLSVASATHCIQDLMLDQLVLGKDAKQPSPTIGIAISTKQDDACQSLDKAELASDIFDLPPLMTMKMPLSATAHPMARIDGASSSVLSPIWHNIHDHFWTTDRSESALADLRAKHQHLIQYFREYKGQTIGYAPRYGLMEGDPPRPATDEITNRSFYNKMCSSVDGHKEASLELLGINPNQNPLPIDRACFLHSDLMVFDIQLHGNAAAWLKSSQGCMKALQDTNNQLTFDLTPYYTTDQPTLTRFITGLLKTSSSYQRLMRATSTDAYYQILQQLFDQQKFTDITISTQKRTRQFLNFGFPDKFKDEGSGRQTVSLKRQINNLRPNLSFITNLTHEDPKSVFKDGFQIIDINRSRDAPSTGNFNWKNTVITKQPWGVVVFNRRKKTNLTMYKGVSGSLLITYNEDDKTSLVVAALHSVNGEPTSSGTGITLGSINPFFPYSPKPPSEEQLQAIAPPAETTSGETSGTVAPLPPPEQLAGDNGASGTTPTPVMTDTGLKSSDDAQAELAQAQVATHVVDSGQPDTQDVCP